MADLAPLPIWQHPIVDIIKGAGRTTREFYAWLKRVDAATQANVVTVSQLPAAADVKPGTRTFVSDANATTFASVVAGSGSNTVPVYSDGTDWRIG